MSSLILRNTASTASLQHHITAFFFASQPALPIHVRFQQFFQPSPLHPHQLNRRQITTSSTQSQQAAARRREEEDPEDEDHDSSGRSPSKQQPRSSTDPAPPPALPREPVNRTTVSEQHLREPSTTPQPRNRQNRFDWMTNAAEGTVTNPISPRSAARAPRDPISTRSDPFALSEMFKDPKFSFLSPARAAKPHPHSQQPRGQTALDTPVIDDEASYFDPPTGTGTGTRTTAGTNTTSADSSATTTGALNKLLDDIRTQPLPKGPFSQRMRTTSGPPTSAGGALPFEPQLNPAYAQDATASYLGHIQLATLAQDLAPAEFLISPALGKTVAVDVPRGIDVAGAFRRVEIRCALNGVKADLNKQRFHERPGLRRKRLVMGRWRKRFREGFKATVRRVEELRRKGW